MIGLGVLFVVVCVGISTLSLIMIDSKLQKILKQLRKIGNE